MRLALILRVKFDSEIDMAGAAWAYFTSYFMAKGHVICNTVGFFFNELRIYISRTSVH